jgi:membrane-associated protease RseP (regulator of RpoE activity)
MRRTLSFLTTVVLVATMGVGIAGADAKGKRKSGRDRWPHKSLHVLMGSGTQLGVHVGSMTGELREFFGAPRDRGVLVSQVEKDSAAAKAGVQVGDVIVSVDDAGIDEPWDVLSALADKAKGDSVEVLVVRNRQQVKLTAAVDPRGRAARGLAFGLGDDDDFGVDIDIGGIGAGVPHAGILFGGDCRRQLEDLETEIAELRERLERLEKK